ncbi:MAG TPA: lipopolysaccharide heptosyltransferase II [Bacteroidetes bacterium]|nr:ADP-heptose--LPS heptosyltransferase 2 [bacterium BMS3Bbin04]HDO64588.1 lipopolysaccharide heptosyltransferase II [Bacteroidota bacterium]HEX03713.1 lipopolysaccharide heptosyltransferase II [Bacteroidota bacterium]
MDSFHRILIVQTAFLGDVVLTLPLVEAVHSSWPEAQVDFLSRASCEGLFLGHEHVDKVMVFDKQNRNRSLVGMLSLASSIRRQKYDLALIPHRSFRSGIITALAGIPKRVGFKAVAGSIWYTDSAPRDLSQHEGARNLSLLDELVPSGSAFDIRPTLDLAKHPAKQEVAGWMDKVGLSPGKRLIIYAPGSVWATKRWDESHWTELLRRVGEDESLVSVMVGGPEDAELCGRICQRSDCGAYNAAGELSILGSATLIELADLLITGDTAPLHLAQAVRTPTLAIFGPTVPEYGFAPTGENDAIIGLELPCRPCAIHGGRECPLGHHDCMKGLSAEAVLRVAQKMLNGESS